MRHVLFAIFENEQDAENCLRAIQALPGLSETCTVLLHRGEVDRLDVPLEETSAREGVTTGALVGSTFGGMMGALLFGPLGFAAIGPLAGALFGMLGGGAAGALGGGLTGAGQPDPVLQEVEREVKNGKVLLTVEPQTRGEVDEIERICIENHGRIARKPVLGFWSHRLRSNRAA